MAIAVQYCIIRPTNGVLKEPSGEENFPHLQLASQTACAPAGASQFPQYVVISRTNGLSYQPVMARWPDPLNSNDSEVLEDWVAIPSMNATV